MDGVTLAFHVSLMKYSLGSLNIIALKTVMAFSLFSCLYAYKDVLDIRAEALELL